MFVTNAPYDGGTHLPDVTVVMPVFIDGTLSLLRRLARPSCRYRRHHAGIHAALFAGHSRGRRAVRRHPHGRTTAASTKTPCARVLLRGPFPARNPAAEHRRPEGAGGRLRTREPRACATPAPYTDFPIVNAYMRHVQDNAEESVRQVIGRLTDGAFEMPMDGGADYPRQDHRRPHSAFSAHRLHRHERAGSRTIFNAPGSVTKAAVLYVFRCLVDSDIPDECRLPQAARHRRARRLAASSASARRGGGRQCRDQPGGGRRAVRRARRPRRVAGNDEQPHLRQRAAPILRDDLRRRRRGLRASTANLLFTPT